MSVARFDNSSAPPRLSRFFLHPPVETFRPDDGASVQAAQGESALAGLMVIVIAIRRVAQRGKRV